MLSAHTTRLPVGLNVLVVDDVADTRNLMNWILRQLHCDVIEEAHEGERALEIFGELNPDITFLDIDMPGIDGLEVLKRIKALQAKAFVVIASGCSSLTNVKVALDAGADGFVVKPFSISKVSDLLRKYVEQQAAAA